MTLCKVSLSLEKTLQKGERVPLCVAGEGVPSHWATTACALPQLRVGDSLEMGSSSLLVVSVGWLPGAGGEASSPLYMLEAVTDISDGDTGYTIVRHGYSLAWITLSDKGAAGKRTDESGPLIATLVADSLDLAYVQGFIIPDEPLQLKGLLSDLALVQGFDLILTTGGTGVGPRDITPEATLAIIEKRLPGFERAMTAASLKKTVHGAISRAVAGTLGQAIIVNMPGSPKAVAECLEPLLPVFRHTLEKLQGDPSDCAVLRK